MRLCDTRLARMFCQLQVWACHKQMSTFFMIEVSVKVHQKHPNIEGVCLYFEVSCLKVF